MSGTPIELYGGGGQTLKKLNKGGASDGPGPGGGSGQEGLSDDIKMYMQVCMRVHAGDLRRVRRRAGER
jgi:hypothetical protein